MTDKQMDAIHRLERAFKVCRSVNIGICGMDRQLLAYDAIELKEKEKALHCEYEAQRACGQGYPVKMYGVYIDSGGW